MALGRRIVLTVLLLSSLSFAAQRLDCWADIMYSLGASQKASVEISSDLGDKAFKLDYTEKQAGSFSIAYDSESNDKFTSIGFVAGPFIEPWDVGRNADLCFKIKIITENMPSEIIVELQDSKDTSLSISSPIKSTSDWQEVCIPVGSDERFDYKSITSCSFSQSFIKNAKIWFDDVYFKSVNSILGITEKPLDQRISEAALTRQKRIEEALPRYRRSGLREGFQEMLFKIIDGVEVQEMNAKLLDILTTKDQEVREKYRLNDHWCLVVNQTLYRLYMLYGSNGSVAPGRLYPETEKALLAELWDRTAEKNDITLARQSTWWMVGSENHDMVCKVSNLISSQIFKDIPEYRDRILPDPGYGGGTGFWFHQMYGNDNWHGPHGRAELNDGKKYNSQDHYQSWNAFMKEYVRERLKKGFFLETFSSGYMGVTISHLYDVYDLSEDPELKELTGKLLDAIWVDWAQDQISGTKGGSKTRAHTLTSRDAMCTFAQFEFGDKLRTVGGNMWTVLVTNYRFPEIVWDIALDRESMGSFEYISRRPGEEQNIWPRPLGTERTMLCDTESRFNRYSWVTPDYILGCQMDHPAAVHSHLSSQRRWQGLIFASDDNARVFPCMIVTDKEGKWKSSNETYFRNFQKNNVMISQQSRRWFQVNPDWYPAKTMTAEDVGVYLGDNLDEIQESSGWIFARKNNAYVALRVLEADSKSGLHVGADIKRHGLYDDILETCYEWNPEKTMVKFNKPYDPVLIHAARKQDYKSFDAFKEYILANELNLKKTVVPGYFAVEYKPLKPDGTKDTYIFNAANNEIPTFNGEYVDYAPKYLFNSPYVSSVYGSGAIEANKDDETLQITLDGERQVSTISDSGECPVVLSMSDYGTTTSPIIDDEFTARSKSMLESQLIKTFPGPELKSWHHEDFALSAMYLNKELKKANEYIIEMCNATLNNSKCPEKCEMHWQLNLLFRIYAFFNSKSDYFPGRLTPEAQKKIEDVMWFWFENNSLVEDADINKGQTWYIWESENHDAMNKSSSWSAGTILSSLPEYRDRLLKDGKSVTEHFIAWNDYLKEYLRERAIKGGLIETGTHTYSKYTLQGWYNFYDFADDPVLKKRAEYMLDLWWTCWALEQFDGMRVGAKSRVYNGLYKLTQDCAYGMSWYYFGVGKARDKHPGNMCLATSNYRLPDVVKDIATDIKGRGTYEFYTRKLAKNMEKVKRTPKGHLLYKLYPDRGGMMKYTYVTPDYIMGSFLLEKLVPGKEFWSNISSQNRWIGVAFRGAKDALIMPSASQTIIEGKKSNNYNQHISVQKNGTMIVSRLTQGSVHVGDLQIYLGDDINVKRDNDKLVLIEAPSGYAALKPAWGTIEKVNDNFYKVSDPDSPLVIEAVSKKDFDSFDSYVKKTIRIKPFVDKKNGSVKYKTIDGHTLTFYYDSYALPEIDGDKINLYPEFTYKSPYLNSKWGDGIVTIEKDGKKKVLNFNDE